MAHTFNLWNLYRYDTSIEFDVTAGSTHRIQHGTTEWITRCLKEFDIEVNVISWDIVSGRAYYYSDYPNDSNLQDRWVQTWKVVVNINATPRPEKQELFSEPRGTDFLDQTSGVDVQDADSDNRAFIIADYRLKKAEFKEKKQQFSEAIAAINESKDIEVITREFNNNIYQIRYEIRRDDLFNARAQDLDALIESIRGSGGFPNWRERLQWLSDLKQSKTPPGFDEWTKKLNISQGSSDEDE